MTALILNGREVADHLLESLKPKIKKLDPKLVVVQVGHDPASDSYIRKKIESCTFVAMRNEHMHLPQDITLEKLLETVRSLNNDPDVSGFIVQLPLPDHLQDAAPLVMREIDPKKDADGFTAYNIGKMFLSAEFEHLTPATPSGVIEILNYYNIELEGKNAVVVGHSNIVGKPLSTMLLNRNATVTTCHIHTDDISKFTVNADILCVAVGKPNLITAEMVKEGVVIIDIGINRTDQGIRGDTDFERLQEKASAITPVPGGVGPMTVACLIRNCVRAKERQMLLFE